MRNESEKGRKVKFPRIKRGENKFSQIIICKWPTESGKKAVKTDSKVDEITHSDLS